VQSFRHLQLFPHLFQLNILKIRNNLSVGFTYDLKQDYLNMGFTAEEAAEFDAPETIEGIQNALTELGFSVDRIGNVRSLIQRLQQGDRWDIVFNICEGVKGTGREAQVPAVLDVYDIPFVFSGVLVLALTLHKGFTKNIIRDNGIPTAPFFVVNTLDDIDSHNLTFPLFVKPVAEGTGKGIEPDSKVYNQDDLRRVAKKRLERFGQSLLVEEFLPGREFTAGITGSGKDAVVVGMMEVVYRAHEESKVYSYVNKAHYEKFIDYIVPEKQIWDACSKVALESWKALECLDGGRIDIRMDKNGVPNFIEVNPLAGLNPIHSDLPILAEKAGISYKTLIAQIMDSALERNGFKIPEK
jgi:D-alanine-D-alanine ligase